ncbi:hypothetical protein [Paenibacillus sp. MMO-58]|uniref:hypothetical protein n=1 Tax=Paenibacillus sp. MMO-58 TaxID=3081290 RepID=UPI0030173715
MEKKSPKILPFLSKPIRIIDKTQEEIIAERRAARKIKIDKLLSQQENTSK